MGINKKRLAAILASCSADPEDEQLVKVDKGSPVPDLKELAEIADLAYNQRKERRAEQKKVDELEVLEKGYIRVLKGYMPKGKGVSGISGSVCHASTEVKSVPKPKDMAALVKWASKTNNPQVFQRRLNEAAVAEIVADGKKIPGVEYIDILKVSLEKA